MRMANWQAGMAAVYHDTEPEPVSDAEDGESDSSQQSTTDCSEGSQEVSLSFEFEVVSLSGEEVNSDEPSSSCSETSYSVENRSWSDEASSGDVIKKETMVSAKPQ